MYPARQTNDMVLARLSLIFSSISYPKGANQEEINEMLLYECSAKEYLRRIIVNYHERERVISKLIGSILGRMKELEFGQGSVDVSVTSKMLLILVRQLLNVSVDSLRLLLAILDDLVVYRRYPSLEGISVESKPSRVLNDDILRNTLRVVSDVAEDLDLPRKRLLMPWLSRAYASFGRIEELVWRSIEKAKM